MKLSLKIKDQGEWERVRARGHRHWVLWQGVIGSGIRFTVLMLIFLYLVLPQPTRPWWVVILVTVVFAACGGYIGADWVWHKAEHRFQ